MIEYIVDFGDKSSAFVGLAMAEVRAHGAELREPIVRCRDCTAYDGEGYGCSYGRGDDPDGFCAWGERRERESAEVWNQWSADDVTCSEES